MQEIELPHIPPIKFAKYILNIVDNKARVLVEFDEIPSLAMLVEASAQSCGAFRDSQDFKGAFLVSVKNVKLLTKPTKTSYEVKVVNEHNLENMRYMKFEVFDDNVLVAKGTLIIAMN